MKYWLFKSEPSVFGWSHLTTKGDTGEEWDGVRNYQARNHMRAMQVGDLGVLYHSQSEKACVGIVEVIAPAHQDSTTEDERWECVDIKAVEPFNSPVTLAMCKADPRLENMVLIHNSRLSVQPVTAEEWGVILELSQRQSSL